MQAQIINISPTGSGQLVSQVTAVVADAQQVSQRVGSLVASLTNTSVGAIDNKYNATLNFFKDPDGWKRLSNDKQIMQWAYNAFHSAAAALSIAPLLHLTNSQDRSVALGAYNILGVASYRNGDIGQTRAYLVMGEKLLGVVEPSDRERAGVAAQGAELSSIESLWRSRAKLACECSIKDEYDNEVYWYNLILDCRIKRGADPDHMDYARASLAFALMRSGDRTRAIEQLTLATKAAPNNKDWQEILIGWNKGANNTIWDSL
jgi:hypothetical protein